MTYIQLTVNGKVCKVDACIPRDTSLNAYLRYHLGLTGTKAMCKEGGCGACIVIVKAHRPTYGLVETFHVNSVSITLRKYNYLLTSDGSVYFIKACDLFNVKLEKSDKWCLVLVFSCHNWEITTVEGLGNRIAGYSDVQQRIAAFNATQCGYCTPGWTMSITSLKDKNLTMQEFEDSLGSNTCRCTGFRPLMDVAKSFAVDASPKLCKMIKDMEDLTICNKANKHCERKCSERSDDSDWHLVENYIETSENETEEIILHFEDGKKYIKVYNEDDIFKYFDLYGVSSYMLVDGNTGKGIFETYEYPNILIDISDVTSLKTYYFDQNMILGANISIEDCIDIFTKTANEKSEFGYLKEFVKHLKLVAHIPVRKIGSLAGNLALKNRLSIFQSDIFLLLAAIGASVILKSKTYHYIYTMKEFLKVNLEAKIIVNIVLPPKMCTHFFKSYKIMPRNQNALAIVNAAFSVDLKGSSVTNIQIVYGDISEDFVYAENTQEYLVGKNLFDNNVLQNAIQLLSKEVVPVKNLPQPSPESRKKLAIGLFYKFVLSIAPAGVVSPEYRSGGTIIERPVTKSTQDYEFDQAKFPLTKPIPKLEAQIQSSGEAHYVNDIPLMPHEVFGAFVLSTIHSGEVNKIDASEVMKLDGVIALYESKDIPGVNSFTFPGIPLQSVYEEILADGKIKYYGQPIAIIVATSEDLAAQVAKKVKVTYKNVSIKPPVVTINEAKYDSSRYIIDESKIDRTRKGTNIKKIIKGVYQSDAQHHYYMEVLSCVVIPVDQGLEVYDSSQWLDLTQIAIARSLGIKESQVLVKVRRLGGGFGGKISRNVQVATACALVAHKLNRPCRFILPMQTNLQIAGRRLPCQCDYEVGVDENGVIQYLDATIIEDSGCSTNENILTYTVDGFPNCYVKDTFQVKSALVVTDLPSNTFARAPGTSEGISSIEHIMEHISYALQKDPTKVRIANMRTTNNDLPKLIGILKTKCNYDKRSIQINQYNSVNRWMKKALSLNVMSFPVVYYGNYSAMVSIYRGDGTVTITTGGIEMGQGVNTKAAQVCAYKLGISLDKINVIPHYSFVAANNVFSGSSIVSECISYAIIKACETLNERLDEVRKELDNPTWEQLVFKAGDEQVDLTATYMMKDTELEPYNAFAVVALEVQTDVLTGRYEITRLDILEDVGMSANPLIDVGQVEGALIQGFGYYSTEKFVYDDNGKLLTNRSLTYHVPLAKDIPIEFNVYLRYNEYNPHGVLGSKAVGELGICTAHSINHALRRSIYESRKNSGYDIADFIRIDVPYDTEAILKALDVKPEEFLIKSSYSS